MAVSEHRAHAPSPATVGVAVLTVSDTRTLDADEGGATVEQLVRQAGFPVVARALCRDEPAAIRDQVRAWVQADGAAPAPEVVAAVLITGGTGVAPRDNTVDVVEPLFQRRLAGFGELFRMLSFQEIGPAAMMSRATAGIVDGVAVFVMPGSPAAVRLALGRLVLPELAHLIGELGRGRAQPGAARHSDDHGVGAGSAGPEHGHHRHR